MTPASTASNGSAKFNGDASFITVYPNPVHEKLTIQLGTLNPGAVMQLYNSNGVLVETDRLVNSTKEISVKTLPAGMYYLIIKKGETTITRKIIKL